MKKLSYLIIGFVIGSLLTYYFCPKPQLQLDSNIAIPKGLISQTQAKKLNDDWTNFRQAAVDSAAKKQGRNHDNRSVLFDIDEIENYLTYSKTEANKLGFNVTGFRLYLGVYGNNAGELKKNLTTIFLVPTGKKAQSKAGYSIFQTTSKDLPISPLNDGMGNGNNYPQ